ncbi:oxidoreductase [Aureococcus anophagefferens]|nr:oxidoreductase [Aureococcus anophagefferens]
MSGFTNPTVTLASGHTMPMVALGTWKAPPGVTGAAVEAAIKAGYRNIDAANDYNNEPEVGAAIAKCIAEGVVTRDELFVQAKLWNTNHRPEHVAADLAQSLEDLQLDYVDSYVIHWPQAAPATGRAPATRLDGAYPAPEAEGHYAETWRAMEALVDDGRCRSIGLSNFNRAQVAEVVAMARVPVSVLQCECHPYLQQKDLIDFCATAKIAFQAFSPLGSGDTHLGVTASPRARSRSGPDRRRRGEDRQDAGQVMLRWNLQRGVCVVAKSVRPARIASNFAIFDWALAPEDVAAFGAISAAGGTSSGAR